jgi:tripartite-type tricarboxylate transporter receptor subunit TctC
VTNGDDDIVVVVEDHEGCRTVGSPFLFRLLKPSNEGGTMARRAKLIVFALLGIAMLGGLTRTGAAWEPTKPIEFVVPAGTGGGADQMARLIAPLVDKYKLSPRPLIVVNKAGGAGAEGFTYVKAKSGDAHTLIITLSNLFTTPLHTGCLSTGRT